MVVLNGLRGLPSASTEFIFESSHPPSDVSLSPLPSLSWMTLASTLLRHMIRFPSFPSFLQLPSSTTVFQEDGA